ncbi:MAG: universal stress protein [Acidobacteria bacterium]|nr:universal stress protein [Acidobacteriota bacterium]
MIKILMATDGARQSVESLRSACRILPAAGSEVELVCIAPKVHPKRAGLAHRLERRAAAIAARVANSLAEEGVRVRDSAQSGSPSRILIRATQDHDVLAIAAASRQGTPAAGLGPVASRVVEHAASTVLVARPGASEGPLKILAPLDGSETGLEGLAKAMDLVGQCGEVTLMHVVEAHWVRPVDVQDTEGDLDWDLAGEPHSEWERELATEAQSFLESARDKLPREVSVNTVIRSGVPADEILSEANSGDYDLVVLMSSGECDLKHRMLGSVSAKVTWNAPCSVLLLH